MSSSSTKSIHITWHIPHTSILLAWFGHQHKTNTWYPQKCDKLWNSNDGTFGNWIALALHEITNYYKFVSRGAANRAEKLLGWHQQQKPLKFWQSLSLPKILLQHCLKLGLPQYTGVSYVEETRECCSWFYLCLQAVLYVNHL